MKNVHKLTEGAVLLAAYAVLILITMYIPVLGVISNLFLAVPFILFGAKNTRMFTFVFFVAAVLISLIVGTLLAVPLTLTYGLTGIVIGQLIKEKKNRTVSFMAASLVFLATVLIQYAVAVVFFKINFIKESIGVLRESIDGSRSMLETIGQGSSEKVIEQFEASLNLLDTLTPSLFVLIALFGVLLIELVSFPIVKRFGVEVDRWRPFREIVLPKSILWYYLLTMLASFALNPEEGTYWYMALMNIGFLLQMLMVLQGLSLISYFCYKRGISKAVPIFAVVFTFIIPIFLSIVRILGIIDLGFDLRKRLEKSK
ncbi:YybS family protein [Bacillus sp. DTU_2020_1000418_1_SI_GHA_SEK_038]|uniref:YybS family protein n=1 Tax=Bacillus sp. DTU_2020_1000418_1_SI_GHA_SEK_038 TaxID=3077585 RepID=UPI0028E836BE|nr:YybS family protein [Bacillus sp. DTU_2020_1000418_1_SI_GHA_SEK_038]WNS75490.1 YybS family protein [Bacillus sp. DTU_2020_1000418_1_SI_GHA_SEK_038]